MAVPAALLWGQYNPAGSKKCGPSDSAVRELHGTLEMEAGEGGGKCSGGTVRTSEAMETGFDLPVLQSMERAD